MTTISYTSARKNLKSVFDLATDQLQEVTVTRRNGKNVVIMSEEEFRAWQETNYLLSNPKNAQHLQKSLKEIATGDTVDVKLDEL